jgi:ABC-2 type transport system ATP-binding protein
MRAAPAILTEKLTKDYNGVPALDGLSLRVEPGEIFGFLGPNGAGKTTTIRLLLDLIRPTAGRAAILGFDCQRDSRQVRARVGYLPGDLRLYPGLRGQEMVELIADLRARPIDWSYVRGFAARLDLDLTGHIAAYSKGTRQKLGVLLALLDRPPVLLLDEPTSGLDPIMQRVVWDELRQEAARGATIFFSSHVLSEVEHICRRVGILRAGRLVAVEPIAALMGRTIRRLEVTFAEMPPAEAFRIPEVQELRRQQTTVWLEVTGNLDQLLTILPRYHVLDLRTEQPGLEEVLLRFYQEGVTT